MASYSLGGFLSSTEIAAAARMSPMRERPVVNTPEREEEGRAVKAADTFFSLLFFSHSRRRSLTNARRVFARQANYPWVFALVAEENIYLSAHASCCLLLEPRQCPCVPTVPSGRASPPPGPLPPPPPSPPREFRAKQEPAQWRDAHLPAAVSRAWFFARALFCAHFGFEGAG